MSGTPQLKVFRNGEYVAACKHAEDAAAIVALSGGEIRLGHSTKDRLYVNGDEGVRAEDSIDAVAEIIHRRLDHAARLRAHALASLHAARAAEEAGR